MKIAKPRKVTDDKEAIAQSLGGTVELFQSPMYELLPEFGNVLMNSSKTRGAAFLIESSWAKTDEGTVNGCLYLGSKIDNIFWSFAGFLG